jgi:hypothetical protein
VSGVYHPTFLYESLWCVGVALLVLWVDRRWKLGHGRAFAVYVAAYTVGRFWIEYLRIDEAHHYLGLRLNDWTSIVVFVGAVAYFVIVGKLRPGREDPASIDPAAHEPADGAEEKAESGKPNEKAESEKPSEKVDGEKPSRLVDGEADAQPAAKVAEKPGEDAKNPI